MSRHRIEVYMFGGLVNWGEYKTILQMLDGLRKFQSQYKDQATYQAFTRNLDTKEWEPEDMKYLL